MKKYIGILFFLFFTLFFSSCSQKKAKDNSDSNKIPSIAVFIPGIIADSPTYAHVVQGVQEAVKEKGGNKVADLYIMEAGTNQSEWSNKLTALAAGGQYDLIVSSNPSLPELASPIAIQFPEQKFIFLDAALPGNIDEELQPKGPGLCFRVYGRPILKEPQGGPDCSSGISYNEQHPLPLLCKWGSRCL